MRWSWSRSNHAPGTSATSVGKNPPVIGPRPYARLRAKLRYPDTGPGGRTSITLSTPVTRTWSMFTDVTIDEPGTVLSAVPGDVRLGYAESLATTPIGKRWM